MIAFTFMQPAQDVLTTDRPRHDSWNELLQEYVLNNGDVKYKQFKRTRGRT